MRKKIKKLINTLVYYVNLWRKVFLCWVARYCRKPLHILNEKQTIDYIVDHKCSVARYGDGELNMMAYGKDIGFQESTETLRNGLKKVIREKDEEFLVCISNRLNKRSGKAFKTIPEWWQYLITHSLYDWLGMIPSDGFYGDANISRLTGTELFKSKETQALYTTRIWNNQNVILIEGDGTRFGVGNQLLKSTYSVQRIIAPSKNAFAKKKDILDTAIKLGKETEKPLFLLALGPTATVLAYDLWKQGFWAIDIGHLDLVYEKTLHQINEGEKVPGRYTNEAQKGEEYDVCNDEKYLSEVKVVIPSKSNNV